MSLSAHYRQLITQTGTSLGNLIVDTDQFPAFTAIHNYATEFETLTSVVGDRPEIVIFRSAIKEFYYSLYACATGGYRHAHIGLRLFFELFSAGIFFSAYEIKLRSWLSDLDGSDINWSAISHPETGIFSVTFLNAFNPDLCETGKQYRVIAAKAYRECSEFVHGNIHTHDPNVELFSYQIEFLQAWMERAEAIRLCVIFCFAGRYLRFLDKDARGKIEYIITESLGHLPAIQDIYS